PPAVGGSGILLENIYSRMQMPVTVLVDRTACRGTDETRGSLTLRRIEINGNRWGVVDPAALKQHVRIARTIRSMVPSTGIVHCGRAQPEGVAAWVARLMPRGPRFLFWAHGEEISMAQTSAEL